MKKLVRKISVITICVLILSSALRFTANIENAMAQYYQPVGEGKITVYPDGRVSLSGVVNQTLTGMNPTIQSIVEFSKSGEKVKVEGENSMMIPLEVEAQFPFETIDVTSNSQYLGGLYNSSAEMSFKIKQEIASKLNLTDFSSNGQCSNGTYSGTAAVHLVPGLPLGQVEINFEGNQTYIHIYGNTTVYYVGGVTKEVVDGIIRHLINITGRGPYSLYKITRGIFECLFFDVNRTPVTNGEFIKFKTKIAISQESLTKSFLYLLISFLRSGRPPLYGINMLNLLLYMMSLSLPLVVETSVSASFQAAYSSSTRQFLMSTNVVVNYDVAMGKITSMIEDLMYIPEIPRELRLSIPYLKNILQQNYCYVESSTATMHYANRVFNYQGVIYIVGNLDAMINYAKSELFEFIKLVYAPIWGWQFDYLNQTKVDITVLKYGYNLTGNQLTIHFENFILHPPLDNKIATSFQLKRFFNLTYGAPSATMLTLTVEGGSNITHYVTITRPENVPPPSSSSDGKSMTWTNPIISSLQDLTFNINSNPMAKGFIISNPGSVSEANPFVCNATDTASVLILIKQTPRPISVIIKNLTGPPSGGETPPSGYKFLGRYFEIICNQSDITVHATVRFYYTDRQLAEAGIDESTLKVFYWNTTSSRWEEYPSIVKVAENYVEIHVTRFSVWTLMGQPPSPLRSQPWFIIATAAIILVVVMIVAVFAVKRRKPKTIEVSPSSRP